MDYVEARRYMVDGQVRPNKVTDTRLLDAMLTLPRERFVPQGMADRAMVDGDVPLGEGRFLMQPMALARLVQLMNPRAGERVLVAAAGTGYGAAVLAEMGAEVVALESDGRLVAIARRALGELTGLRLRLEQGDLAAGWTEAAPYDAILIEGAVTQVPEAISSQLAEGGRLVTVLRPEGQTGRAVLGRRTGGAFSAVPAFDCQTERLPGFSAPAGFVFA
ncbi:protein-L-isoaspartate O-methyltransferase [Roseomonas gilardii]|uniref:protein-L-isoaspartate O-methyltransferase family protein n=1 Tax=Roseomonas gilardii TaxID=257708 RepID=UPI0011A104FC|nr:protein-L-isoaspartate O-methyltransferase [Roseomonas gilardii]